MIASSFTLKEFLQSPCHFLKKQKIHLCEDRIPLKITFSIPLLQSLAVVDGKILYPLSRKRNGEMTMKMKIKGRIWSSKKTYYRHLKILPHNFHVSITFYLPHIFQYIPLKNVVNYFYFKKKKVGLYFLLNGSNQLLTRWFRYESETN